MKDKSCAGCKSTASAKSADKNQMTKKSPKKTSDGDRESVQPEHSPMNVPWLMPANPKKHLALEGMNKKIVMNFNHEQCVAEAAKLFAPKELCLIGGATHGKSHSEHTSINLVEAFQTKTKAVNAMVMLCLAGAQSEDDEDG